MKASNAVRRVRVCRVSRVLQRPDTYPTGGWEVISTSYLANRHKEVEKTRAVKRMLTGISGLHHVQYHQITLCIFSYPRLADAILRRAADGEHIMERYSDLRQSSNVE